MGLRRSVLGEVLDINLTNELNKDITRVPTYRLIGAYSWARNLTVTASGISPTQYAILKELQRRKVKNNMKTWAPYLRVFEEKYCRNPERFLDGVGIYEHPIPRKCNLNQKD